NNAAKIRAYTLPDFQGLSHLVTKMSPLLGFWERKGFYKMQESKIGMKDDFVSIVAKKNGNNAAKIGM
ncbi:hypothetical protein, partial [uncultured Cyclobacterium sp.]|uniref:hypothetical protein n=1 Tax=uncultured Cyclobacterium sp. TaxID=453820 RepID=UPI0030EC29DF